MCDLCRKTIPKFSRRRLLIGAGSVIAASALGPIPLLADKPQPATGAQNAVSPGAALQRLLEGNVRYAANEPAIRDFSAGRAARAAAQHPIAAVLSCSDSRVTPELCFDQGPGDLFVVRVAGNFVNVDGLASLEYAVEFLGVPLLMVLGHSNCGAVSAALGSVKERAKLPGHLPELIEAIDPAVIAAHGRHPSDLLAVTIEEHVRLNVKHLKEDAPVLSDALADRRIDVVGALYDLPTGKVRLI